MHETGAENGGSRHPLPESHEARHEEIPEHLERDKGRGDDGQEEVRPTGTAVNPDGESYEIRRDQAEHQDRGQSSVEGADRD